MAKWWALIDSATGSPLSFADDPPGGIGARLPAGAELVAIDHQPRESERWDAPTRTVVPTIGPRGDPLVAAYAAALTTDAKLDVIARRLGLR